MIPNVVGWRCRLGFHSWYRDAAMFSSADRCRRCNRWRIPALGFNVDRERDLWEKYNDLGKVAEAFLKGEVA